MKKKIRINTIINLIMVLMMTSFTYSWMVTEPSYGETIDYERDLIIASSGTDVEIYIYEETDYVLYEGETILINNMAPNDTIRFKFVMKNTKKVATLTDIIFANITGDLDVLSPYLSVECSSPQTFIKTFSNDISTTSTYDGLTITNYMKFYEDFKVESGTEGTIYWTLKLDKTADNSVALKTLEIENIIFLNS